MHISFKGLCREKQRQDVENTAVCLIELVTETNLSTYFEINSSAGLKFVCEQSQLNIQINYMTLTHHKISVIISPLWIIS